MSIRLGRVFIVKNDLSKFLVSGNISILDALKEINNNSIRTVFCIENNRLCGVLSDPDVRRWIIEGGALDAFVKDVMNKYPVYLKLEDCSKAQQLIFQKSIDAIPIVDDEMHIIDVVARMDFHTPTERSKLNMPVVMMAGGKGTRLYPYTKILPKPLIPMGELPIAEHIINQFREYGCQCFYLIVNHKKNMIKAYFNEIEKEYDLTFVDEEKPLGTGGGLGLLKGLIHDSFILTNCDILIHEDFSRIYKYHKEHHNIITMICASQNIQIPYGIVNLNRDGHIESVEEKPSISFCTNTGCYIVEPEVIDDLEEDTVVDFPDIIEKYRMEGKNIGAYVIDGDAWLDMGKMDGLKKMQNRLKV